MSPRLEGMLGTIKLSSPSSIQGNFLWSPARCRPLHLTSRLLGVQPRRVYGLDQIHAETGLDEVALTIHGTDMGDRAVASDRNTPDSSRLLGWTSCRSNVIISSLDDQLDPGAVQRNSISRCAMENLPRVSDRFLNTHCARRRHQNQTGMKPP
jgi:hypothetical protein